MEILQEVISAILKSESKIQSVDSLQTKGYITSIYVCLLKKRKQSMFNTETLFHDVHNRWEDC